jgi:hypothetical protein
MAVIGKLEEIVGGGSFINIDAAAGSAFCFRWVVNRSYPVPARVIWGEVINRIGPWFLQQQGHVVFFSAKDT